MEKKSIIQKKSFDFALTIIKVYQTHISKKEFILSKQLIRCATSIGANVEEASGAFSKKDFIAKISIALKEAKECNYWLRLLQESNIIGYDYHILIKESDEIKKILTSIIKTSQENLKSEIQNSKLKIQN